MAGDRDPTLGSESMEATPAFDATRSRQEPGSGDPASPHHDPESLVEALEFEPTEAPPLSLASRLRQPRTILSIVVPLGIIGFFLYLNRERLAEVPQLILQGVVTRTSAYGAAWRRLPVGSSSSLCRSSSAHATIAHTKTPASNSGKVICMRTPYAAR